MKAGRLALLLCAVFSYARCHPCGFAKTPFTIEEAALGGLSVSSQSGSWISDDELEFFDKENKTVKVYNASKNTTTVVLQSAVFQRFKTTKYAFSPDRKLVLLIFDEQTVFRHSKKAKFAIHSLPDGKEYTYSDYVQVVEWAPKQNNLVFIKNNDIYLIRNVNVTKVEIIRVTDDGKPGFVYNGIGDWVYEEEILGSNKAFWISPEGNQMAYVTFFDNTVRNATIEEYGNPMDLKDQYTKQIYFPYPKAGSPNPTYRLRYFSFKDPQNIRIITKWSEGREVFYNLMWMDNSNIIYVVTNRAQNMSKFYSYSVDGHFEHILDFLNDVNPKGWANPNLPHAADESRYLRIAGSEVKGLGKFRHLLVTHRNRTTFDLTPGVSEVLKILYWNEPGRWVYFLASEPECSTATQLYVTTEYPNNRPECLSCRIKSPEGRGCKDVSASFSKRGSFILLSCNGPDPKIVSVYKNTKPLGNPLLVLEDNSKLRKQLKEKLMPEVVNLEIEIVENFKADVRLLLPPNADRSGKTRYPLVVYVYGGPASKNIKDAFNLDWDLYMSTNLNVIYARIDGRNTLRKGENVLFAGYRALGTLEMDDQIFVTELLRRTLSYVDPKRTGIWGWSYGGYATTKILEMDTKNIFKCGIAVAPVADWIYYDSMYTERYMGLPQDNKLGYERASVLRNVTNLRNKEYFLIHGNADDNVHYQNAMMIAKKLERENIPFELMSYPDEDHSLRNVRKHLYYTMSRFWKKCFYLP